MVPDAANASGPAEAPALVVLEQAASACPAPPQPFAIEAAANAGERVPDAAPAAAAGSVEPPAPSGVRTASVRSTAQGPAAVVEAAARPASAIASEPASAPAEGAPDPAAPRREAEVPATGEAGLGDDTASPVPAASDAPREPARAQDEGKPAFGLEAPRTDAPPRPEASPAQHPAARLPADGPPAASAIGSQHAGIVARHDAATAAVRDASPSPQIDRLLEQLHGELKTGRNEFRLTLDPPDLGRVDVRIVAHGDGVVMRMVAERGDVAQWLRTDLPALQRAAERDGLHVVDVEVRSWLDLDSRGHDDRRAFEQSVHDAAPSPVGGARVRAAPARASGTPGGASAGIDLFV